MALEEAIRDIRKNLKQSKYPNESSITNSLVNRLLGILGWNVFDPNSYIPEYKVQNGHVDIALCPQPNKPRIFIEVKKPGNIVGADEQVFTYAFHQGIPFIVATDGAEWQFHLSVGEGTYTERRICSLDLQQDTIAESVRILNRYLSFDEVKKGNALENAQKDYKAVKSARQAKENIPIAWETLVKDKDETLVDLVFEKVIELCDMKPDKKDISNYLSSLRQDDDQKKFVPTKVTAKSKNKKADLLTSETNEKKLVDVYFTYKGYQQEAKFNVENQRIIFDGQDFSPSGFIEDYKEKVNGRRSAANGWTTWRYKDKNGNEHQLDTLRKK